MIRVTCAIIRNDEDEILVVQCGEKSDHPFKWEFPGGKVGSDETDEESVIREIEEELSMSLVICNRLPEVDHDYGHKHIILIPFVCDTIDDLPFLSEHNDYKWLSPGCLMQTDFTEADVIAARSYLESIKYGISGEEKTLEQDISVFQDNDLRDMIIRSRSIKEVEWVAVSAVENPFILKKLLEYSRSNDKKLAVHSAWAISKVCDRDPILLHPFLPVIIDSLPGIDIESTERSLLRVLSMSDMNRIGRKYHGTLADHCFNKLRSVFSAVAIKAYSMEIIFKLAVMYPGLANELSATIIMLENEGSAGVVARGKIILKKLAEITPDHGYDQP